MLQYLVGMHDVEAVGWEVERVDIADGEVDGAAAAALRFLTGERESVVGHLESGDAAGSDALGEVDGDGARAAADVEQTLCAAELRQQVCRRIIGRTSAVRAQDAGGVAVGVAG